MSVGWKRWVEPACLYVVLVGLFTLGEHWLRGTAWRTGLGSSLLLVLVPMAANYRVELRRAWRAARGQRS